MCALSENVPPACSEPVAARPRVLLVEDDPTMVRLVQAALQRLDVDIRASRDGEAALGLVRSWCPRLVILDLNLPRRSGLEVLRRLRREAGPEELSVLVLTAHSQVEVSERAFESGADDYLVKPIDLRVLIERVRSLLAGRGAPA